MTFRRSKRAPTGPPYRAEVMAASALLVHNYLVHRALRAPVDAALNLAFALGLTSFALRTGCTRAELGLERADLRGGLRIGSVAAASCSAAVVVAATLPATRHFFLDARLSEMSRRQTLYHATVRIPVATALAEEVIFRSALHALFAREHTLPATLAWTSLMFGLWHILPTLDTFEGNPASNLVENIRRARWMAALGTTGATAAAGLFFSYLTLRSRSVSAAVVTHAAINIAALLVGKSLVEREQRLTVSS